MKKLLLLLVIPLIGFCQSKSFKNSGIDNYKYFVVETTTYKNSRKIIIKELKKSGYNVLDVNDEYPEDLEQNPDLALYISSEEACGYSTCEANFYLQTSDGASFYKYGWQGSLSTGIALKRAMRQMLSYRHNYKPKPASSQKIGTELSAELNFSSEKSIRDYFDENGAELFEGIWEYASSGGNDYKLAIVKDDYKFIGFILEGSGNWKPGDIKVVFETAASDELVTVNWTMGDKRTKRKSVGTVENNALIEFTLDFGDVFLYRVYPKLSKQKTSKNGEWAGNGSGIIISKSGHIVTNYHVIEDADDIEVEFIVNGEVQKFNAEVVQSDKVNDLSIIKIFDMNFDGLDNLPYNFKTRSSDVGTKVYAYGYPMALSLMGKEIKITDGIISSKSGFDGDITTYQITAPIQGGNSGGPLFDDNANFLGINSSGLSKEIAENVGYTIKSSYVLNLIDVLPKGIDLPSSTKLKSLSLTEQIKEISKYVVLVKVK
jgi:S1-C subfamily serine protease